MQILIFVGQSQFSKISFKLIFLYDKELIAYYHRFVGAFLFILSNRFLSNSLRLVILCVVYKYSLFYLSEANFYNNQFIVFYNRGIQSKYILRASRLSFKFSFFHISQLCIAYLFFPSNKGLHFQSFISVFISSISNWVYFFLTISYKNARTSDTSSNFKYEKSLNKTTFYWLLGGFLI